MQEVSHHGRTTTYETFDRDATGDPVLFVHGSGASRRVWKSQARLADEFPVIALDLSGHGGSSDTDATAGFEALSAYADDVLAVADETGANVLVGNSLGGAVVLHILLEREVEVEGVVLAGTGAKLAVLDDLRDWLANDFERAIAFLHGPDRLFHDPDPRLVELSKESMHACGRAVTERDFLTCHTFDVRGDIGGLDVPTLCVVGEYDQLTPPRYHDYLADAMDGRAAVVEDAAHLAMLEQPGAFNSALARFVARVQG